MSTKIEWTDAVWNPITGCNPISEGCQHCYAKRMANRLRGRYGYPKDEPFRVTVHQDRLGEPWGWKKPRRVFVCSMGDLFHEDVRFEDIERVFYIIQREPEHTFIVLTKRPRTAKMFLDPSLRSDVFKDWPFPNVWLGVTAENQARADERIPILLQIPAAIRFVSVEPMLGPVDMDLAIYGQPPRYGMNAFGHTDGFGYEANIQWVICGAETGTGARPMDLAWARDLRNQCGAADVPFFMKKIGTKQEPPPALMIRQWPLSFRGSGLFCRTKGGETWK